MQYGAPAFLTAADSTALGGGVNFFAGGPGGATSAATQVVDVSGAAAEIDAGKVAATLSALLGGYATQTDHAAVTATFLNAGGRRRRGAVAPAHRHARPIATSTTALIARTASGAVPAGTRQISVRIDAIRDEGSYNDGYIDNVSLVLGSGAGASGLPQDASWSRRQRQGPRPAAGQQRSSSTSRAPRGSRSARRSTPLAGVVELSSVPKAGGKPQTGQFYEGVFKVTQTGSVTSLALTEPLASCRGGGRSAAATKKKQAPPLGRRQGRRSARRASTARPPCAARSGSSRTAAPAP